MTRRAVVVVGLTDREITDRAALLRLADSLGASVAYLQLAEPSLSSVLTRLADEGHSTIELAGMGTGLLPPASSWLRRVAAYWWRLRSEPRPDVRVATDLLPSYGVDAARAVLSETRSISGAEPGLTSAAWQEVTGHRHQVMLCRGPRCTAKGAEESVRAFVLAMLEERLGDDDALLVHTGCQFPCNQSPVVIVQPDDVWYGHVDAEAAGRIVREHLVGGQPVESHRLPRTRH